MNKIPLHKVSDLLHGEMAMMRYLSPCTFHPSVTYAHKDDYYIFFFMRRGQSKLMIDFEEFEFSGSTIHCLLPGQVHRFPAGRFEAEGWILIVDNMLIKDEYKDIFEKTSLVESRLELEDSTINELQSLASTIGKRSMTGRSLIEQQIVYDLISAYIGLFAEIYQKGFPISLNNRLATITFRFKSLLSTDFRTFKRPSEYASLLHITPVYLNEAVKKTTGQTVSECIQQEIIMQAKRLLFYTTMSIKEVALDLGYEDWAYFTRLFTKVSGISPSVFRKKYIK